MQNVSRIHPDIHQPAAPSPSQISTVDIVRLIYRRQAKG
jgi:hypothetical protein